jgi:hypothetical protein
MNNLIPVVIVRQDYVPLGDARGKKYHAFFKDADVVSI